MTDYTLFLKAPQSGRSTGFSTRASVYATTKPIRNITEMAQNWERTERLVGGFWDATFSVVGEKQELQQFFTQWLNYVIEERCGIVRWSGNVWSMALTINGVTREVSLNDVYNAVRARFTEHLSNGGFELGSGSTFTDWTNTNNAGSIAQETAAANLARGSRAVKLESNAMVSQSVTVNPKRAYRLSVQTKGEAFNDVVNGDFETLGSGGADVFDGWSEAAGSGTITAEGTQVAKGTRAAKLSKGAILYQSVAVRPKYEYKFSVYTRTGDKISLTNGNLEAGSGTSYTGWTNVAGIGSINNETTIVAKGSRAVKLSNGAKMHQTITVKPKHEYEFSVHTRTNPQVSLTNGNLEDGLGTSYTGWTNVAGTGSINNELTNVAKGNRAVRLTGNAYMHQAITVKPGNEYKFGVYTRGDGTVGGRVTVYDVTNGVSMITTETTGVTATSYRGKTYEFVAPPSCTSIRVEIHGPNTAGSAYFDAMEFQQITQAACGRVTVYDVTNSDYIVKERPTGDVSDSYSDFSVRFVAPPSCTSIRVEILAPVQGDAYFDDMSFSQMTDDACGTIIIYDNTNSTYIVNSESTGVVSDRYTRYERSFVAPPSCTSINISLIAPPEGDVYFDQAELDYVTGANGLRMRVYDNTNAAYIVFVKKTGHTGDKYAKYDLDFVTPPSCVSIDIRLQGGLDSVVWLDEASLTIYENDQIGNAYTDWVTDTASIARYGRKEFIVDAKAHPRATAATMANAVLNKVSWPMIKESSFEVGNIRAPILQVYCLGLIPQSNNRYATEVNATDTNAMLTSLINQTDYLFAQNIDITTATTARLDKDTPARALTEIVRNLAVADNGSGFVAMWTDRNGRVTATTDTDKVPRYFLRDGIIAENFSGSQPASPRQIRPGIVLDAEWLFRSDKRNYMLDKSGAFLLTSVKVSHDGKVTPELATTDELNVVLESYK